MYRVQDCRSLDYSAPLNDHPIRRHDSFLGNKRNITWWSNTSSLRHWYHWSNIGNIVGTSTWVSRDRAFYSPRIHCNERIEACRQLFQRFDHLLLNSCGFHCWVQWGQGERLFCEHNRACCLSCDLTWIRFDAPEGQSLLEDIPCRGE